MRYHAGLYDHFHRDSYSLWPLGRIARGIDWQRATFVYWLGRKAFNLTKGVRFPYVVPLVSSITVVQQTLNLSSKGSTPFSSAMPVRLFGSLRLFLATGPYRRSETDITRPCEGRTLGSIPSVGAMPM